MGGASPRTIEHVLKTSVPDKGFPEDLITPSGAYRTIAGLNLTGSTGPDLVNIGNTNDFIQAFKWDHDDATTVGLSVEFPMPRQWARYQRGLMVRVTARKVDAASDENTDLQMQAQVRWRNPSDGATWRKLTTPALSGVLAAATIAATSDGNGSTPEGFADYDMDIGARLEAEGQQIHPGAIVKIEIGGHETIGTTDMDLQAFPPLVGIFRHGSLWDTADRNFAAPVDGYA